MPPLPISLMISSCGNFSERSTTDGGLKSGAVPPVSVPVGKAAFSRHSWQSPFGALAASGLPQLGHRGVVSIFARHFRTSGIASECYRLNGPTKAHTREHIGSVRLIHPLKP